VPRAHRIRKAASTFTRHTGVELLGAAVGRQSEWSGRKLQLAHAALSARPFQRQETGQGGETWKLESTECSA